MRPSDLEFRALAVLDIVAAGKPFEDSLVELKVRWPDVENDEKAYQTARQMAGHLNAARGDAVIWLIGVGEKEGICGAPTKDLANEWWPKLRKHFDHYPPEMINRVVSREGKVVTALRFDGTLLPFVVKVFGKTREMDVPWREGDTRSATRSELLRILAPETKPPLVEVLSASTGADTFACSLLVTPRGGESVRFVQHRTTIDFDGAPGWVTPVEMIPDRSNPGRVEPWIHMTPTGLVLDRGGTVIVKARCPQIERGDCDVTIRLAREDPTEPPLVIRLTLVPRGNEWVLKQ